MGTKGSQRTDTGNAPPTYYQNAYQSLSSRALDLSLQPYQPYGGQGVAPVNQTQLGALSQFQTAAQPLTQAQISQYYNPYQQNVINATEAQFANTNAQQFNQADANAVMAGAYGGTGNARAKAMLAGQQQLAEAPTIAGLEQQGWQQSVGLAGQQFQQQPEAAAQFAYGVGTQEQQTQTQADQFAYQQYLAAQGYPFQALGYATGAVGGLGSLAGGTGYVTAPPPSLAAQYGGLGLAGIGAAKMFMPAKDGGRVAGLAGGGAPGNMPYAGGLSYVPGEQVPHGSGPPHPVNATAQDTGVNQILQNATRMAGTFKGGSGTNSYGGGNIFTDAYGGSASNPLEGLDREDYGADGGRIMPRAYGGLVLPQRNRIEYKRGGPIRAGLGFSSFVPRRGYQDGGSPEEGAPATFDERFSTQPGLAQPDFNARFQGETPTPPWIMQPGLEPPAVAPPPPSVPQATPVQTAGVGQEDMPAIVAKGPEATTWEAKARRAAEAEGVDADIFAGIIHQESGFNPNVRDSSAGATGIAQFMRKTAASLGVNPRDPDQSLQGAARYLKQLLVQFNGDYPKAIAAYNAGPGRVASGAPLPTETQRYVPAVMAYAGQGGAQDYAPTAGVAPDEGGYTPPPPNGRTSGLATGQEPPSGGGGLFGRNQDAGMALMAAGFGMAAAGARPGATFAGAAGQGGLTGLGAYGALQREHLAEAQLQRQNARETELERHQQAADTEAARYHSYEMNKPQVIAHAKDKYGVDHPIIGIPQVNKAGNIIGWKSPAGDIITDDMLHGTKPLPASATPSLPAPATSAPSAPVGTTAEPTMPSSPVQVASAVPVHIPTGMKVAGQAVTPDMVSAPVGKPKQYNEKAIADLDDEDKAAVQALVRYDLLPNQLSARSAAHADLLRSKALMYDPRDPSTGYPGYQPAMAAYINKGKYDWLNGQHADMARKFSVAIDHVDLLKGIIANLNNQDSVTWSKLKNAWSEEFGGTMPTNFDAASRLIANEIVGATVGTKNALGDRDEIAANFSRNKLKEQQLGVIDTYEGLMAGQLHNMERQYKNVTQADDFKEKLLSPRAREVFYGHGQTLGDVGPKEGERKRFKEGWGVFRNGKWGPE